MFSKINFCASDHTPDQALLKKGQDVFRASFFRREDASRRSDGAWTNTEFEVFLGASCLHILCKSLPPKLQLRATDGRRGCLTHGNV